MKKFILIILTLSFFCLIICAVYLTGYFYEGYLSGKNIEQLVEEKETAAEKQAIVTPAAVANKTILTQYESLYRKNHDLIGWIRIGDTPIDYPVMQNRDEGEYYLHRNFEKEYEYRGLPFLDKRCDISLQSTNLIIYGHNMKSDAMFSSLLEYQAEEYYFKHPVIEFDTLYEQSKYEIVAVIRSKVYKKTDKTFKFYQFVEADTKKEFDEFVSNMKSLSLYDTGVDAAFGDQLLTLVTCSYHTKNGRLAVLAKKVNLLSSFNSYP